METNNYLYVERKSYLSCIDFNFYKSNLDEINSLEYKKLKKKLIFNISLNKFTNNISFDNNIDNTDIILQYSLENNRWELTYENNKTVIIKSELVPNYNILSFDLISIKNYNNLTNYKKIIDNYVEKLINFHKNNKLIFLELLIDNKLIFNNDDYVEEDICIICFDKLNNSKAKINLNCNHTFHTECLQKWFEEKNECPICREKITINKILNSEVTILTAVKPNINYNNPIMSFFPIRHGKPSSKNIKLEHNDETVYKIIKMKNNIFAIEFKKPLNIYEVFGLTFVNLITTRNSYFTTS